jgi:MoaA/NifB/PqqE/SkfB family radical SAM enzyme
MSTELFSLLLDRIKEATDQYRAITFAGMGEPLLDPEFLEKARISRSQGFRVLLLTNGSRLTIDLFRQLDEIGMESIRVSFYGMRPESYSRAHGVNHNAEEFERLKDTLSEICALPRTTKMLFTFNVVEGGKEQDLKNWIRYWEPQADLIEVWRPHNWVYGRAIRTVSPKKRETCGRPFRGPLQVQVDGTVNMCCFDFNGDLTLGDLKTQSLSEIFEGDFFQRIYDCHLKGNFENSGLICKDCDQRNVDKSDVLVYNSKFDIKERVEMTSSTYTPLRD